MLKSAFSTNHQTFNKNNGGIKTADVDVAQILCKNVILSKDQ